MNSEEVKEKYRKLDEAADREIDRKIAATTLQHIPTLHRLFAKYREPQYLEHAKEAGVFLDSLYKKYNPPVKE